MNSHLRALIAMSLPSMANMTTFPLAWIVFWACPVGSGCLSGEAVSVTTLSAISTRYFSVARRRSPFSSQTDFPCGSVIKLSGFSEAHEARKFSLMLKPLIDPIFNSIVWFLSPEHHGLFWSARYTSRWPIPRGCPVFGE